MDFPLPLTLVLMMTEDADRYAARAARESCDGVPSSRDVLAPPRSGVFAASAPSERLVSEPAQRVA